MRIAFIIPSLESGGAERVASELSRALSPENGIFFFLNTDKSIAYEVSGIVESLKLPASGNALGKVSNFFRRLARLRRLKRRYRIEASLSFMPGSNLLNILTRGGDRIFLSEHTYESAGLTGFYGRIFRQLIRFFYNKADGIVAVSTLIASDLSDTFGVRREKITVIHNPVDIRAAALLGREPVEAEDEAVFTHPVVITVGRLSEVKAQWKLIRAFSLVREEFPDARLVIVGKGELETYLKDLAVSLGIAGTVRFTGYRKNPFAYLSKSRVFVLSSLREGFPNVVVEAMACGVPVVSADCLSGPREICAPGTVAAAPPAIEYGQYGILVPAGSGNGRPGSATPFTEGERMLAKAVCTLFRDEKKHRKYSEAGLERAAHFDIERIRKQYKQLLLI